MPAEKFEGEHIDASPEAGRDGDDALARVLVASEAGSTIRRLADVMDLTAAARADPEASLDSSPWDS